MLYEIFYFIYIFICMCASTRILRLVVAKVPNQLFSETGQLLDDMEFKDGQELLNNKRTCNICLTNHNARDIVKFSCTHTSCRDCIVSYFTTLINDANINSLKCPELECESQASPDILKQLLPINVHQRYNQLLLASIRECLDDAVQCPNQKCETLVFIDSSNPKLAYCSDCKFEFCVDCKKKFHNQSPCTNSVKSQEITDEVIQQYIESKKSLFGFWKRFQFHRKYDKKILMQESKSREWIERQSRKCPYCRANIQKVEGCNKMTCWRCNTYFCWLCSQILPKVDPYWHFRDINSRCALFNN